MRVGKKDAHITIVEGSAYDLPRIPSLIESLHEMNRKARQMREEQVQRWSANWRHKATSKERNGK